jgi:hypothetical protein
MDVASFDSWLQTIYSAGPNSDSARSDLHSFADDPGSLDILLEAISSGCLTPSSLHICLSLLRHVRLSGPTKLLELRDWFSSFLFSNSSSLHGDPVIGLVENVFLYVYEGSQRHGAELIQRLSLAGPSSSLLAMRISKRIIDEMVPSKVVYLVPLAVAPLADDAASAEQVDAAAQLLLSILSVRANQAVSQAEIISSVDPHRLATLLYRHSDPTLSHLLQFLARIAAASPSAFANGRAHEAFLTSLVRETTSYVRRSDPRPTSVVSLLQLCTALKKCGRHVPLDVLSAFLDQLREATESLLAAAPEAILDFWTAALPVEHSAKIHRPLLDSVLEGCLHFFFESEDAATSVLADRSTTVPQKIAAIADVSFADVVAANLRDSLDGGAPGRAAMCIEYLACANAAAFVDTVVEALSAFETLDFALSLCHFFRAIPTNFRRDLSPFYVRLLSAVQTSEAPLELVNEVMKILETPRECSDPQVFDLIASSQVIEHQSGRQTRAFFGSLFMLGYGLADPSKVVEMIEGIVERADLAFFPMLTGAFIPSNCRFEFVVNGLQGAVFPRCQALLKEGNAAVVYPLLKLVLEMVRQLSNQKLEVMSEFVVGFVKLVLGMLLDALRIVGDFEKGDFRLFKGTAVLMLILAELVCCPLVNFGVMRLYEDKSFDDFVRELFELMFMLSFAEFLRYPKFVARYMKLMGAMVAEDLLLQLPEAVVVHHLHLLLRIIDCNAFQLGGEAARVITSLIENASSSEIEALKEDFGQTVECVMKSLHRLVFAREVRNPAVLRLVKMFDMTFVEYRDRDMERLAERFPIDWQPKINVKIAEFVARLAVEDLVMADPLLRETIRSIVGLVEEAGIDLKEDD